MSSFRPVPKPAPVQLGQRAAEKLAQAQGHAFADIAADAEALDAHATADRIDADRDPLIVRIVRLAGAIEHDLRTSRASRALATQIKAAGLEAIRKDRLHDEHRARERAGIAASIDAGRSVVAVQESLLTGTVPS